MKPWLVVALTIAGIIVAVMLGTVIGSLVGINGSLAQIATNCQGAMP